MHLEEKQGGKRCRETKYGPAASSNALHVKTALPSKISPLILAPSPFPPTITVRSQLHAPTIPGAHVRWLSSSTHSLRGINTMPLPKLDKHPIAGIQTQSLVLGLESLALSLQSFCLSVPSAGIKDWLHHTRLQALPNCRCAFAIV